MEHMVFMVGTFWYMEMFSRFSSGAIIQIIYIKWLYTYIKVNGMDYIRSGSKWHSS